MSYFSENFVTCLEDHGHFNTTVFSAWQYKLRYYLKKEQHSRNLWSSHGG